MPTRKGVPFTQKERERVTHLITQYEACSSDDLATRADIIRELNKIIHLGTYEHFKSTKEEPKRYTVIGITNHKVTGELTVAFHAHYGPFRGLMGNWPLVGENGFVTPKVVDNTKVERFVRINKWFNPFT